MLVEAGKQRHSLIQFIEFAVFIDVGLLIRIPFTIDLHKGANFLRPTSHIMSKCLFIMKG